jgi:hypothetical protein
MVGLDDTVSAAERLVGVDHLVEEAATCAWSSGCLWESRSSVVGVISPGW